jgi:hypothetical protein
VALPRIQIFLRQFPIPQQLPEEFPREFDRGNGFEREEREFRFDRRLRQRED